MRYTILAGILIIFWGCSSDIEPVSPNSRSPVIQDDYPETSNILPLLDQAITELLQDDVSAELNIELPSCGDIVRDGWIHLAVSTN